MGEGPSLATPHLIAVPLTMWNAGFVADEVAGALGQPAGDQAPRGHRPGDVGDHGSAGGQPESAAAGTALLRHDLRRRATAGPDILTWVIRGEDSTAVGMLSADTENRRTVVTVSIAPPYRRRGYATEALRAVAGWVESGRSALVEARVRLDDVPSERLARATAFLPTDVLVQERWRVWLRPPPA
ncbi:MAG: GNAT family N-acetyltransferase [Frankia sp.]